MSTDHWILLGLLFVFVAICARLAPKDHVPLGHNSNHKEEK